jgi:hypothetical protein
MLCDGTTKPIDEIQKGDFVWSRDDKTGEMGCRQVVRLKITPAQRVLQLQTETPNGQTETFGVTEEHPFWIISHGWKSARELRPGDKIFTSTGGWVRVTGSTWQAERQTVYNFEVQEFHTYFVGESRAWVHNADCFDEVWESLSDGDTLSVDEALTMSEKFLGDGYKDMGGGRFVSADGSRQVRMGDSDILGQHGGGPHINFERLSPNPKKPGKMMVTGNKHIYLSNP